MNEAATPLRITFGAGNLRIFVGCRTLIAPVIRLDTHLEIGTVSSSPDCQQPRPDEAAELDRLIALLGHQPKVEVRKMAPGSATIGSRLTLTDGTTELTATLAGRP